MIKLKKHTSSNSIINPTFFTFFFIFHQCLCFDQNYESCVPKDCGDGRNISYPFWINGLQDPTCGYPGFELRCNINGSATLQISENKFIIKQIEYKNNKILLQNAAILSNRSDYCLPKMMNVTLDPNRFTIDNDSSSKLILISNCSGNFSENLEKYKVRSCNNRTQFVVLKSDVNLGNIRRNCGDGGEIVEIPVELGRNTDVDGGNYMEVVNRGFVLRWLAADCGRCETSGGRCGFNMTAFQFRCFCTDGPHTVSCKPSSYDNLGRNLGLGLGSALLSVVLLLIIYCITKSSPSNCVAPFVHKTEDHRSVEAFVIQYGSKTMKRYNYHDIKKMTKSFQVKLGQGGFGTVFKGKLSDGRLVAIKVLNTTKASGQEFINEVASIGRTSHVNIVTLLGFCFDYNKRALVYEFMPNGSLEKFIHSHVPITTSEQIGVHKLYEIALGIARGLDYLHRGCNTRILHLDIKPHNILLDEDFCPKIADFGLAKLYSRKESIVSMLEARGTIGYIAPEVFNRNFGEVSHKSDVYSYGMLILEMVGGRKNVDAGVSSGRTSEIYFPYWIYNRLEKDEFLLDSITTSQENDYARKMTIVGLWCIQTDPNQRPSIQEVIEMLEGRTKALEVPPKPFFSSSPRLPLTTPGTSESESESIAIRQ